MCPKEESSKKIITIPNLLSAFRLLLIPVFVWTYCVRQNGPMTAGVLALSGVTDLADGYIARRFHMVSDLGKMLDPVADKLTQGAMLICLVTRFPRMWLPLILLAVKETIVGITSMLVIRKSGAVAGAAWHGKVVTASLYLMMLIHIIWPGIPGAASDSMIAACLLMMLLSLGLYAWHNLGFLVKKGNEDNEDDEDR